MLSSKLAGHALALTTVVFWGLTFVSSKVLLRDFTPVELLVDRFVIAALALYLLLPRRHCPRTLKGEMLMALAGMCGGTLYFVLENNALRYSLAANVSILVSTAPLFTAVLNRFTGDRAPLRPSMLVSLLLAFGGTVMLELNSHDLELNPLGDALAVLTALVWAVYTMTARNLMGHQGYSAGDVTRGVVFYTLLTCLPLMWFDGYALKAGQLLQSVNLLNLIFLGVVATSVCYLTWNRAMHLIGPVRCTAYLYLQSAVTAAGAAFAIGEEITLMMIGGMILIVAGLAGAEGGFRAAFRAVTEGR